MSTERPRRSSSRPLRLEPAISSLSAIRACAAQMQRSARGAVAFRASQREPASFCAIFVELDEVAQRHGKLHVFGHTERIIAERVFKARDDDRKAKRIEARIHQNQAIGQGSELPVLLTGDFLELRYDRRPYIDGHCK